MFVVSDDDHDEQMWLVLTVADTIDQTDDQAHSIVELSVTCHHHRPE